MKKKGIIIGFISTILMFFSCMIAETQSEPKIYNIKVSENDVKVFLHQGAGEYLEIFAIIYI